MSVMVKTSGVEHIGLFAQDTIGLARWYMAVFGATEVSRSADSKPIIFLSFQEGSLIELIPVSSPPAGEKEFVHVCFAVEDLQEAIAALHDNDVKLSKDVFEAYDHTPVAFFHDPEGNLVQLAQRPLTSPITAAVFGT